MDRKMLSRSVAIMALAACLAGSGVAAQSEAPATATSFSGTWTNWGFCAERVADGDITDGLTDGGPTATHRGIQDASSWTATDDRLTGDVLVTSNVDRYDTEATSIFVTSQAIELVNEGGTWSGATTMFYDPAVAATSPSPGTDIFTMTGAGGYEGLITVLQIVSEATMDPPCDIPFAGVIVDGELPPSE